MPEIRYRIEPESKNPYMTGIAFIIAAVVLYLPLGIVALEHYGALNLGTRLFALMISLYAGLVTMGCVLVFTIPVFWRAEA